MLKMLNPNSLIFARKLHVGNLRKPQIAGSKLCIYLHHH